ncbi:adenylyltransferase/cytidyltransferase family protein [Methanolapillus ohkumae]|uniref:FAD synthase n=1 Tax=Methanolapillus ohkumae TaxID=3028298 RepID=A0AA96V6K5_9EURY|nr:Bifunctional protein HldE [Methanosarcinaceae archaeon Am2]
MTRVLATGTFDILHPGHLSFLEQAKSLGDELYVIIGRDVNIANKPKPIIPENQRLLMVQSLKPVDCAVLGSLTDYFEPLHIIQPDIIVLGFNQQIDEENLKKDLNARGFHPKIVRLLKADTGSEEDMYSSRKIIAEILQKRCFKD